MSQATQLNGHQQGDMDFNLSLGANWGKAGKAASKVSKLQPLIDPLKQIGANSLSGLKKALGSDPDKWAELVKTGKTVKDYAGGGVEAAWDFTE